ncbi:hypothetical protein [Paenibacillus eucommiae]|uniref:DHHA1 domain-containing protein n=1 Tax=Paenibacillus eucommiae TaxID=1355755 RepID=A0ABS4IM24_9BACL|nr:hypothetical protein [Paenibacillus eucommiae]MBP1988614.1 hypothetical protein [Paenibacillus eucommiae]
MERVLDLTMFFIVKVRMWKGTDVLTMKNIVKVADSAQLLTLARGGGHSSSLEPATARKSPLTYCPFELGVRAIRTIVAKERERLWAEER